MNKYKNLTASASIKTGPGTVSGVIVNSHSSGTLKLNDGLDGTAASAVKATGVLTGTDVFTDGETVTVGARVYTFKTALSAPSASDEILIGANLAASLDNLKVAINAGAGAGTAYSTGTIANVDVTATTNTDTAQTLEAVAGGVYGNSVATTETGANASFAATTLANGAAANTLLNNTMTFASGERNIELFEASFSVGLYATIGGTADITIIYS